jgi:hypothetical protein
MALGLLICHIVRNRGICPITSFLCCMKRILTSSVAVACFVCLMNSVTLGQVVFQFDYSSTTHFNATSKASLESAASTVASWLNHNATIEIKVTDSNANTDTLASAGSNNGNSFTAGSFADRGVVGTKLVSNGATDPNEATSDGTVDVNFFHNWDFDDSIATDAYDFKSTMLHELLHAVGFSSSIAQNGNDLWSTTPGNAGYWAPFDKYVADKDGSIISAGGILDATKWNAASVGGTGTTPANLGLYFNGSNAVAANGGNPVPIYSPTTWEGGSSGSHLDDNFFTGNDGLLMNASTSFGPGVRSLSTIEIGVLQDIGLAAVPEPSEYALVTGVALFVFAAVRKRCRQQLA